MYVFVSTYVCVYTCVPVQWVNGVEVVSHSGGHLPFEANITDLVKTGTPNRITVAINNTLTPHTLPPGTLTHGGPPDLPEGFVSLNYQFDFYNYAGECPHLQRFAMPAIDKHYTYVCVDETYRGKRSPCIYSV